MRIHKTTIASVLLTLSALSFSAAASAQTHDSVTTTGAAPKFGAKGSWVFSTDASINIQRRTQSNTDGATTSITLVPAADYFIISHLSIGGFVGLDYIKTGGRHSTRFAVGPRVGYDFVFAQRWSIWPKLGFSYAYTKASEGDSENALALNLFAPVLFHPVSHFFAGFGPFVDTDLNGDHRATTWGGKLTIGGWL